MCIFKSEISRLDLPFPNAVMANKLFLDIGFFIYKMGKISTL